MVRRSSGRSAKGCDVATLRSTGFRAGPGARGATLTRLDSIDRAEVVRWAQESVPPSLCEGELLIPGIRRLFERWDSEGKGEKIPMEPLAAQLRELLYGYNSRKELT